MRGLTVDYREADDPTAPTVVLLHGFPTSSHMFRGLIEDLAGSWRVIAPDRVGFGASDAPPIDTFEYTFDQLAATTTDLLDQLGVDRFVLYVQNYGAPIGLRIASRSPHRVTALIVQNGNAYEEGLTPFWDDLRAFWTDRDAHEAAVRELLRTDDFRWQYTHGVPADRLDRISPDTWRLDRAGVDRPGNVEGRGSRPGRAGRSARLPRRGWPRPRRCAAQRALGRDTSDAIGDRFADGGGQRYGPFALGVGVGQLVWPEALGGAQTTDRQHSLAGQTQRDPTGGQ